MALTNNFLNTTGLQYYDTKLKNYLASNYDNVIESVGLKTTTGGSFVNVTVVGKQAQIDLSGYALKSDITSVMHYKGSVPTYAELPLSGMLVGDMYNVVDTGVNYAWTGSTWDPIGSSVDLGNYYTKAETDGAISAAQATTEAAINAAVISTQVIDALFV